MFFPDKYEPRTHNDACFNKKQLAQLYQISQSNTIPHIIVHGPPGSGKQTLVKLFLEMIYDRGVHRTVDATYTVTGNGSSTTDIIIQQSNYHIVIEPSNNNFDKYIVQDVIKEYARSAPMNFFATNRCFKTVFINNADHLSYYAQISLRRTMEKFAHNCRFIMLSSSLSKICQPLQSRCFCLRLEAPSYDELAVLLFRASMREGMTLSCAEYDKIINLSNHDAKRALWILNLRAYDMDLENFPLDEAIDQICTFVHQGNTVRVREIRTIIYYILVTNVEESQIIKLILQNILEKVSQIDIKSRYKMISEAAKYEHRLIQGRREIKHIEAFVISLLTILHSKSEKSTSKSRVKPPQKVEYNPPRAPEEKEKKKKVKVV